VEEITGVRFGDFQAVHDGAGVAGDHGGVDVAPTEGHAAPSIDGILIVHHNKTFDVIKGIAGADQKLKVGFESGEVGVESAHPAHAGRRLLQDDASFRDDAELAEAA